MTLPPQQRNRRIFITGFMASGKSTLGPILANSLGFDFLDLDAAIAAQEGKSIREIFGGKGERYFRRREREILTALGGREGIVVSLGGGTLSDPDTLSLIMSSGILVYLKVPPEEIIRRLRHKTDRPMVLGVDGERLDEGHLRERVGVLLASREPLYALADLTIEADQVRLGLTVDRLVRLLTPLLR